MKRYRRHNVANSAYRYLEFPKDFRLSKSYFLEFILGFEDTSDGERNKAVRVKKASGQMQATEGEKPLREGPR